MKQISAGALFTALALTLAFSTAAVKSPAHDGARPNTNASGSATDASKAPEVDVLTIDGAIQPITAEVIVHAIDHAERDQREALVIRIDTPGGLDTSMREIIKRILVSRVPVVVYVAPSGSRAASAGTFIAMAAHVAAMSPGTSIGAATPVNLGGGSPDSAMSHKVRNDAVSYIRSMALQRGRNADWAEKAVREGSSLNEGDALKMNVIDLIARDDDDLFRQLDGRKVLIGGTTHTLHTKDAVRHALRPSWRQTLLSHVVDPNVAYILFMLGFYGLIFELSNPGSILPGVVGGICIVLALLAFQTIPINTSGLALIVFAMVLFIIDLKVQSHGILTAGGVVSLVLGSLLLIGGDAGTARLSLSVVGTIVGATLFFFLFVLGAAFRAQRRRPVTGLEGLVGLKGTALTDLAPEGRVFVRGEYWEADSSERIERGAAVVVDRVDGLRLKVHRA
ncbi:MAG TPA: nodulation protein NfeD [Candidatus Eisenbacteria bacterium]|nr:nodulation protein NfeD [Candidatus Eisenbacteria bacterium]